MQVLQFFAEFAGLAEVAEVEEVAEGDWIVQKQKVSSPRVPRDWSTLYRGRDNGQLVVLKL